MNKKYFLRILFSATFFSYASVASGNWVETARTKIVDVSHANGVAQALMNNETMRESLCALDLTRPGKLVTYRFIEESVTKKWIPETGCTVNPNPTEITFLEFSVLYYFASEPTKKWFLKSTKALPACPPGSEKDWTYRTIIRPL